MVKRWKCGGASVWPLLTGVFGLQIRLLRRATALDPGNPSHLEDLAALLRRRDGTPNKSARGSADGSAEEPAQPNKQDSSPEQVPGKSSEKQPKGGKGFKVGRCL